MPDLNTSDLELVHRVAGGDASAANIFVSRYRFVVTGALRHFRSLTPADVEDLFQEASAAIRQ